MLFWTVIPTGPVQSRARRSVVPTKQKLNEFEDSLGSVRHDTRSSKGTGRSSEEEEDG